MIERKTARANLCIVLGMIISLLIAFVLLCPAQAQAAPAQIGNQETELKTQPLRTSWTDLKIKTKRVTVVRGLWGFISHDPVLGVRLKKLGVTEDGRIHPISSKKINKAIKISWDGKISVSKKCPRGNYLVDVIMESTSNPRWNWISKRIKLKVI